MSILHFAFCILHFAVLPAVPIDGDPFEANLVAINADWQLTFDVNGQSYKLPAADLVYWGKYPGQGRAAGLLLTDGSRLTAEILAATETTVTVQSNLFGKLTIPINRLGAIYYSPRPLGEGLGVRADAMGAMAEGENQDTNPPLQPARLLLTNNDQLPGHLLSINQETLKFQTDLGPIELNTQQVHALTFPSNKEPPKNSELRAWTAFRDGSRLLATHLSTESDQRSTDESIAGGLSQFSSDENGTVPFRAAADIDSPILSLTVADQSLTVPQNELVYLQPLGGRAVYLSDLEPTAYGQTSYLDLSWPYAKDQNLTGGPLQCNGQQYIKGLALHSAARLVYIISPLPPGEGPGVRAAGSGVRPDGSSVRAKGRGARSVIYPKTFQAELGIDDSTAARGSVRFRVFLNGRQRYASETIRGNQPPTPISIDLRGATKLELIVDYADRADVQDHALWLNARLIK